MGLSGGDVNAYEVSERLGFALEHTYSANELLEQIRRHPTEATELTGALVEACDLPAVVVGIRKSKLVRWDDFSSTWDGISVSSGRHCRVRVYCPPKRSKQSWERFVDEASQLSAHRAISLNSQADQTPCYSTEVGAALGPESPINFDQTNALLGRCLLTIRNHLQVGLYAARLTVEDLKMTAQGIEVIHLGGGGRCSQPDALKTLARLVISLTSVQDNPVTDLLHGWCLLPPTNIDDAGQLWTQTLATMLTQRRHQLAFDEEGLMHIERKLTLFMTLQRLQKHSPVPIGKATIATDLSGAKIVVRADGQTITATNGNAEPKLIYSRERGVQVLTARRLARFASMARISEATPSESLLRERTIKFIEASLGLRTLLLLLKPS